MPRRGRRGIRLLPALSPRAVENLRFDEGSFSGFHGYDADICFPARSRGRRVRVVDTDVFHHIKASNGDEAAYARSRAAFAAKWAQQLNRAPARI